MSVVEYIRLHFQKVIWARDMLLGVISLQTTFKARRRSEISLTERGRGKKAPRDTKVRCPKKRHVCMLSYSVMSDSL